MNITKVDGFIRLQKLFGKSKKKKINISFSKNWSILVLVFNSGKASLGCPISDPI